MTHKSVVRKYTRVAPKSRAKKSRARKSHRLAMKSRTVAAPKRVARRSVSLKSRKPRKNVIGPLAKGDLTKYGYHNVKSMSKVRRHRSLSKAVKQQGFVPIIRKLNAIAVLSKNRDKTGSAIFREDQQWLSELYKKLSPETKAKMLMVHKSK